jgi:hypothetical protein
VRARRARALLAGGAALVLASHARHARAEEEPSFGLAVSVATENGSPVSDDAWIEAQIAGAEELLGPLGVHVRWRTEKAIPAKHARLETRADRDALTGELEDGMINVFVVASLRDVDDPSRQRMGVCWRHSRHPSTPYLVVARTARPTVLAHELGHFFGNPHSGVSDNVMSYTRTGGPVFFDDAQAAILRALAQRYLKAGTLLPATPNRVWP